MFPTCKTNSGRTHTNVTRGLDESLSELSGVSTLAGDLAESTARGLLNFYQYRSCVFRCCGVYLDRGLLALNGLESSLTGEA